MNNIDNSTPIITTNTITIFSMRLAGFLMQQGFMLLCMEKSDSGNGKNVFFFNYNKRLQEAMDKYKALQNKTNK